MSHNINACTNKIAISYYSNGDIDNPCKAFTLEFTQSAMLTLSNVSLNLSSCLLTTPQPSSLNGCHSPTLLQLRVTVNAVLRGQMKVVLPPARVSGQIYVVPLTSLETFSAQHMTAGQD